MATVGIIIPIQMEDLINRSQPQWVLMRGVQA